MTKTEFSDQFKRLRIAGYRLPVFDGVKINDVIEEWYATFQGCSKEELAQAIDRLKQQKTDTFWPATGEIWAHITEVRKARRIRQQVNDHDMVWGMSDEHAREFLARLRETKEKILGRMTMPDAVPQVPPDHCLVQREGE